MTTQVQKLTATSFDYYPVHHLFGVVDDAQGAERVIADLARAGIATSDVRTWSGPEGASVIDSSGLEHGTLAHVWRGLQHLTVEHQLIERYADEARQGHVCIGVHCQSESEKATAISIFERHAVHLITYLSVGSIQRLRP